MTTSITSRKTRTKKQTAADEAPPSLSSVVSQIFAEESPVPDDWAADLIRRVLAWQIEQIDMKPSEDPATATARAKDARTMTELVRTLERLDAVNKRRESKGKKTKPRDDTAIKEQFVRKLDQLLAARDTGGAAPKSEPG